MPMAKLVLGEDSKEIPDGSNITDACRDLGIVIACGVGVCGACKIKVLEGMENLNELTQEEKDFGLLEKDERLACVCKIKSGTVKIKSAFD